jgi:hypothetical protein
MKENEELNLETFHRKGGKIFFVNSLLAVYILSLSYITGTFFATFLPSLIFLEQCQLST